MEDYLLRTIAKDEKTGVRALICVTTGVAREGARRHQTSPGASVVLGRGLTAAALMGALLKVRQRVALKFAGNGPLEQMVTESDSYGRLRGYVLHPEIDLPFKDGQPDVAGLLGNEGILNVVKDLGLPKLYEGVVPLVSGMVDEDIAHYLNQSEQITSAVTIGVALDEANEIAVAGGILLQALPGHDDQAIYRLEERLQEMPPVEDMLLSGETPETIAAHLFGDISYVMLEKRELRWECSCSRERSMEALKLLPQEDLIVLMGEGQAVVDCHFCHERYAFSREELSEIWKELYVSDQTAADPPEDAGISADDSLE